MGLIKALTTSISSGLGDQFKEFVTCPNVEANVLIVRGEVGHGKGNSNPTEGVLSNGTAIAVPDGMAMMIIDNGKIGIIDFDKSFLKKIIFYTFCNM